MNNFKVDSYRVYLGYNSKTIDGTDVFFHGRIELGGTHESGSQKIVNIFFLPENSPFPKKPAYRIGGKDEMYVPMSEMPVYIDLLRNESPIWISIHVDRPEFTNIVASYEKPGEGE